MKNTILKDKSYLFALRIIKVSRHLVIELREYVLAKQILRSGTSIGANVEEALQAESRLDFIHKLAIANKEAAETHYWIRLLKDSELLTTAQAKSLLADCDELQRMLVASIKTAKRRR